MASREGSVFSPSGVLRLILNEDEQDNVLEFTRDVLLQIKVTD